jgi:hypothetical protein
MVSDKIVSNINILGFLRKSYVRNEEGIVGTQYITINRTSACTNQGGIVWVKCVLDYLRSSLLKRRKAKYKWEREAKESRVNTQLAPCPPDPHYSS